jgi:hypothetical protein
MKLVQRRCSPEGEGFLQERMREDLDERATDDQILLDLKVLHHGASVRHPVM